MNEERDIIHCIAVTQAAYDTTKNPRMKLLWGRNLISLKGYLVELVRQGDSESMRTTYR